MGRIVGNSVQPSSHIRSVIGTLKLRTLRMPVPANPAKKLKLSEEEDDLKSLLLADRLECGENVLDFKKSKLGSNFKSRVRVLCGDEGTMRKECKGVMYWMWRDKRVQDNWALLYAQKIALECNVPLHVCVCVPPHLGEMTIRHFTFMLEGLKEVAAECAELNIVFHLLAGTPPDILTHTFLSSHNIGLLVADFSPLKEQVAWLDMVVRSLECQAVSLHQVDAHNIVPVWVTRSSSEGSLRTQ